MVSEIISNLICSGFEHTTTTKLGFTNIYNPSKRRTSRATPWRKKCKPLESAIYLLPNIIPRCTVLKNTAASSILGHKYCEKKCAVSNLSFSTVIKHLADGSLCIFILQHTKAQYFC